MEIEYILKVNRNEMSVLAEGIHNSLERDIKRYYLTRQKDWLILERDRLELLKLLCAPIDDGHMYKNILDIAEGLFKEYNEKNPQIKGKENENT